MAARTNRPLGRRLQARMMRVINVPMRILLGLRFATPLSGRLMLVFLTGRKTRQVLPAADQLRPPGHDAADPGRGQVEAEPPGRPSGAHPATRP
jgi:hypothetical protein